MNLRLGLATIFLIFTRIIFLFFFFFAFVCLDLDSFYLFFY